MNKWRAGWDKNNHYVDQKRDEALVQEKLRIEAEETKAKQKVVRTYVQRALDQFEQDSYARERVAAMQRIDQD